MITRDEVLKGHDKEYPLDEVLETNLRALLNAANTLRIAYGKPMIINSGYRPAPYNKSIGGAPNSAHITCQAIDIKDEDGAVKAWLSEDRLVEFGLWMEDASATPSWCHIQVRPAKNRVFKP